MKFKLLLIVPMLITHLNADAQKNYFNTLNDMGRKIYRMTDERKNDTLLNINQLDSTNVNVQTDCNGNVSTTETSLSIDKTTEINNLLYKYIKGKRRKNTRVKNKIPVLSFYDGESHELTMANVLQVMDEAGINNQIIVLAQSLLETGFYTSRVCKECNNLFGLRSPHGYYYHFARWEDSVIAYQKFVQYRYKEGNYFSFLRRIGYAEDPRYIAKVAKLTRKLISDNKYLF